MLDFGKQPIAHDFLDSASGVEPAYPFKLYFCEDCGFIQIIDMIPADLLYKEYFTLSSWKHQPHIPGLIEILKEKTGLSKDSRILEVGSNDGIFLEALKQQGYERAVGIEPAADACKVALKNDIKTIASYFTTEAAKEFVKEHGKCDLFISRHNLEHIQDLKAFKEAMRIVLDPGSFVLFEVPNFSSNLKNRDYSLWEEHVNYFTSETLNRFLEEAGIKVIHEHNLLFSGESLIIIGQYLGKEGLDESSQDNIKVLRGKIRDYAGKWPEFRQEFIGYLKNQKAKGKKIAIYGAGARLCSLVNFTGIGPYIEFVVDDQREKQGKFMPGSKLEILPSAALSEQAVDLCLLAVNSESEEKVIVKHSNWKGSFVSVLPPSQRLPGFWLKS